VDHVHAAVTQRHVFGSRDEDADVHGSAACESAVELAKHLGRGFDGEHLGGTFREAAGVVAAARADVGHGRARQGRDSFHEPLDVLLGVGYGVLQIVSGLVFFARIVVNHGDMSMLLRSYAVASSVMLGCLRYRRIASRMRLALAA